MMDEKLLEQIKKILSDFTPDEVDSLVLNIQEIQKSGIVPGEIFPLGIVRPDGVYNATGIRIRSHAFDQVTLDKIPNLIGTNNQIGQVNIFPLGIIKPEQFNAEFEIKIP